MAVTVQEKRDFIQWFLNHYEVKKRECSWILQYLLNNPTRLENVHFVSEHTRPELLELRQKFAQIGTKCVDLPSFRYYTENSATIDPEVCFHQIRLKDDPVFINLRYKGAEDCPEYYLITEDEDILEIVSGEKNKTFRRPVQKSSGVLSDMQTSYSTIHPKIEPTINNLIENVTFERQLRILNQLIDDALDRGDKETFMKLTTELNEMKTPQKIFETVKR